MPRAIAINCSLKGKGEISSTDKLVGEVVEQLRRNGCDIDGTPVRVAMLNVPAGVSSDEGPEDDWPELRKRILDADILVFGTPIWLGQPSSIAKRVLERMDAFLGETDNKGRMPSFGRVALVVVVGNEDGAHHVSAELFQALSDVGFTIPAGASVYWVGEAMNKVNYTDLKKTPENVASTAATAAANATHLARLLSATPYPSPK